MDDQSFDQYRFTNYDCDDYNEQSLAKYLEESQATLVYQKFDNTKFNTIPFNNKRFYASVFVNLSKIFKEDNTTGQVNNLFHILK